MTANIVSIQEANYVDPRAGNDKFYRTFVIGSFWVTQYGRNGTLGTFTKVIEAANSPAAMKAADAKFLSKVKKGYNPVRSGEVSTSAPIELDDLSILDSLAQSLPMGATHTIVTAPVSAVELQQQVLNDLTPVVAGVLNDVPSRVTTPDDISPTLPMRPMLASIQPEASVVNALVDKSWVAQYKYDGDRVVVEITDGAIRVLNRQGLEKTKNVGHEHLVPFSALHSGRWVFDGEVVGRTLVIFDLAMATNGAVTWIDERIGFERRSHALGLITAVLSIPGSDSALGGAPVVLAPTATTRQEKMLFLDNAVSQQREGIILRHAQGPYEPGRRSTTLIKHKLIKDADVIVSSLHGTKDSATLSVYDAAGQLIEVGAASTIGKGDVVVGDVWVTTFLYVTDPAHPRMFQPRLVNRREDKQAAECTLDQFTHAGTSKIV